MAYILSVGTSLPKHHVDQQAAAQFARSQFKRSFKDIDRLLKAFNNGEIESRQFVQPIDWYQEHHSFEEKNNLYVEKALAHAKEAVFHCLHETAFLTKPVPFDEVDALFFISSTGLSTPSLDAKLMNVLPFSPYTKRVPIWGLGCGGGAAGLSRAYEYIRAYPEAKVLVVACELCSLTFQPQDQSKSNLIGTSLFGDGTAAVLLTGEKAASKYTRLKTVPKVLGTQSVTMKDSEDVMGWDFTADGFRVIFSRDIPSIISGWLKEQVDQFLHQLGFSTEDVSVFLAHPGGKKVIDAYLESLSLQEHQLFSSKEVLKQHGNMSSATVLYVMKHFLEHQSLDAGQVGLCGALGPGFSSELLLMKWEGLS
ncbi:3-oxoacyl-[acyl-carrier-protein] synthase III C-terminal domain-containing protein [Bacillus altitudinis]|uniref:type III polyketide synthase n=1 Tax=Bacillus altitudinis TaxID=293387 RepID=UPI0024A8587E|nr:3-oxoacyl-[acyl-carrier-protein] synthase III C-terminal domain-containing protein [Bacillus altitudinis]WHF25226.1 3-oxoacyl-[acyl-carrier-protein] synthase III C-terminal domain-containing protein [Bacillus altitudinis]